MGRIVLLSILTLFVIFSVGCEESINNQKDTEMILPRLNLEEGGSYNLNMDLIQTITDIEKGTEEVTDQSINIDFLVKVTEASGSGAYTLVADVKKATLARNIPLKETIEINSAELNKPDLDTNYVKMIRSLIGKSIILEMDDKGKITSRRIVDKSNRDSTISNDRLLPRIFGEQLSSRQSFEMFFPFYPEDSVALGKKWYQEFLMESTVPILTKNNISITIDSLSTDSLNIKVNTELIQQKSSAVSKEDAQKSVSGDQSKEMVIDRETGWPVSVEVKSELKVMDKIGLKILKTTSTTINFTSEKVK